MFIIRWFVIVLAISIIYSKNKTGYITIGKIDQNNVNIKV